MIGQANGPGSGPGAFPPSVEDFYLPSILPWGAHDSYWFTKFTLLVWLAVARADHLLPGRLPEAAAGADEEAVARRVDLRLRPRQHRRRHDRARGACAFAPYLTTLFCFILLTNLFGIVPLHPDLAELAHRLPGVLAVISYVLFNYVGIRQHGFVKYFKHALIPPAPWFILPLLIPIEFFSTFIVRPVTLAVRLFANMFAGHMILLVFTLGGFALLNARRLVRQAGLAAVLGDGDRADLPRGRWSSSCRPTSSSC